MNQVTKKKESLPTTNSLEEFAGQGTENITASDVKLPILKLIGSMSPQINPKDSQYVEGLKVGDIYNDTTGSIYDGTKGFLAVPCYFVNTFNEWSERGTGSSRPIVHTNRDIMDQVTRGQDNKDWLPKQANGEQHYIEDTGNHFVYILNENYEPVEPALITMKSTQKKHSKRWNSMIQQKRLQGKNGSFHPPSFGTVYRLSSVMESNSKGSWPGWNIAYDSDLSQNPKTLAKTKEFYKDTSEQSVNIFGKVDFEEKSESPSRVNNLDDVPI